MTGNSARVSDLRELAGIWRRRGLTVSGMTGWEDRGREAGNTFEVLGCHHTAAAVDVDRILRDGRSDVPGPLCNVALHRDGEVVLVASGRANHFGVATWSSSKALGVEATGPPFENYAAYVQLAAGFCEWKQCRPDDVMSLGQGIPVYRVAAHKEVGLPYGRKVDPGGTGFNDGGRVKQGVLLIDDFRADVAAALGTKPPEDDMPLDSADKQFLIGLRDEGVCMTAMGDPKGPSGRSDNNLAKILTRLDGVSKRLDAIEARLPAPPPPPA